MDHRTHDDPKHAEQKLTQLLARELGALPLRRAPASLESRVFAELARRQALPWWRQSFRAWPMAAQVAFAVITLAVTHALFWVLAGPGVKGAIDSLQATGVQLMHAAQALVTGFGALRWVARDLFAAVPGRWLLTLLLAFGGSLVVLFGSGAFVYRSLRSRA